MLLCIPAVLVCRLALLICFYIVIVKPISLALVAVVAAVPRVLLVVVAMEVLRQIAAVDYYAMVFASLFRALK
jgi:hypothetical protein